MANQSDRQSARLARTEERGNVKAFSRKLDTLFSEGYVRKDAIRDLARRIYERNPESFPGSIFAPKG
jgi:hypothetical protein